MRPFSNPGMETQRSRGIDSIPAVFWSGSNVSSIIVSVRHGPVSCERSSTPRSNTVTRVVPVHVGKTWPNWYLTFSLGPVLLGKPGVMLPGVANIPRTLHWGQPWQAFLSSCAVIATLVMLFGLALYPNLVTASNDPALSVTIFSAASSAKTLTIMLIIAGIGMPFVLAYTSIIYWAFRGKVKLDDHSY